MNKFLIPTSPNKNFEGIKKIDENGVEYWNARELMLLMDYSRWENFEQVIIKAREACFNSNQEVDNHFLEVTKMVTIGSGGRRKTKEYRLSRYACYLIAQNGDPTKKAIAQAQTYFAIQTRKQELFQIATEDEKRLYIRSEVKEHNKKLFTTAYQAGVKNFGKFNNMGYLGLYGMRIEKIKERKKIGKDDILDRAGSTELAANLFRITQTDEKIKNKEVKGEGRVCGTHYSVGAKVRRAIVEIGGILPENLSPEKHIKEIEKDSKKILKATGKMKLLRSKK